MSTDKLPFGLVLQETAIVLLLLVYRLLLLRYVLVVGHNNAENKFRCFVMRHFGAKLQKKSHMRKFLWDFFDLEGMITAFFGHEQIWAY